MNVTHSFLLVGMIFGSLLFASCTDGGGSGNDTPADVPVSFSALSKWDQDEAATRTETAGNKTEFSSGDAFGVFAYYNDSQTPDFMNNQKVSTADGTAWSYEPVKYWPQSGEMKFCGYFPYRSDGTFSFNHDGSTPTFVYTNNNLDADVMAAEPVTTVCPSVDGVKFDFKHLMSKVNFVFTYTQDASIDEIYEPVIHKVELEGVPYSGTFSYKHDENGHFVWDKIGSDLTTVERYTNDRNGVVITKEEQEIKDFCTYLFPGSVIGGTIKVVINNVENAYSIPEDSKITVGMGQNYTLNFKLKRRSTGNFFIASFSMWEDGGEISGELK